MRKTLTTATLVLAFSFPTLAGEIGIPGSPVPPTTATVAQEPTTNGWIQNGSAGSLTQIALDLLAALF